MGRTSENPPGSSYERRSAAARLIEERKMRAILGDYEPRLGGFELIQVGDAGWILQSRRRTPRAHSGIIVNCDVDDTLLRSSEVKAERTKRYKAHLVDHEIHVPDADVEGLMKATYDFVQINVGRGSYLTENHAVILDWATRQLQRGRDTADIQQTLTRIGEEGVRAGEGFVVVNGMVLPRDPTPALPEFRQMFRETLTGIAEFQEPVDALVELTRRRDEGENIHVNLFTQGNPPEQLLKVFGLMDRNRERGLLPDQIFITDASKDEFIRHVIATKCMEQLPRVYTDGQERGDGYLFGAYDHAVVDVDDSIQSLETKVSVIPFLEERVDGRRRTGTRMRCIRLRRNEAKDGWKAWAGKGEHVELNLSENPMSGVDLAERILVEGRLLSEVSVRIPRSRPAELPSVNVGS